MATRQSTFALSHLPFVEGVEFRPIPNCDHYVACSDGSIWSGRMERRWKRLRPDCRAEDGRKRYTVRKNDGAYRRAYGSHYVLEAFAGPRPAGMVACHRDGNCLNDSAFNLRWDTDLENHRDMIRHGTQIHGEAHPKSKIADDEIPVILQMRRRGETYRDIGFAYGVTAARIHQICKKGAR